jgi:hypothetical protein
MKTSNHLTIRLTESLHDALAAPAVEDQRAIAQIATAVLAAWALEREAAR